MNLVEFEVKYRLSREADEKVLLALQLAEDGHLEWAGPLLRRSLPHVERAFLLVDAAAVFADRLGEMDRSVALLERAARAAEDGGDCLELSTVGRACRRGGLEERGRALTRAAVEAADCTSSMLLVLAEGGNALTPLASTAALAHAELLAEDTPDYLSLARAQLGTDADDETARLLDRASCLANGVMDLLSIAEFERVHHQRADSAACALQSAEQIATDHGEWLAILEEWARLDDLDRARHCARKAVLSATGEWDRIHAASPIGRILGDREWAVRLVESACARASDALVVAGAELLADLGEGSRARTLVLGLDGLAVSVIDKTSAAELLADSSRIGDVAAAVRLLEQARDAARTTSERACVLRTAVELEVPWVEDAARRSVALTRDEREVLELVCALDGCNRKRLLADGLVREAAARTRTFARRRELAWELVKRDGHERTAWWLVSVRPSDWGRLDAALHDALVAKTCRVEQVATARIKGETERLAQLLDAPDEMPRWPRTAPTHLEYDLDTLPGSRQDRPDGFDDAAWETGLCHDLAILGELRVETEVLECALSLGREQGLVTAGEAKALVAQTAVRQQWARSAVSALESFAVGRGRSDVAGRITPAELVRWGTDERLLSPERARDVLDFLDTDANRPWDRGCGR